MSSCTILMFIFHASIHGLETGLLDSKLPLYTVLSQVMPYISYSRTPCTCLLWLCPCRPGMPMHIFFRSPPPKFHLPKKVIDQCMPPPTHSFACNTRLAAILLSLDREARNFFGKKSCRNSLNINKSTIDNLLKFVKKYIYIYIYTTTILRSHDSGNGSLSKSRRLFQGCFQINDSRHSAY